MNRRAKVELFEQIRREYEFGIGTIKGIAEKFGVHRRMVRQALASALPPERKSPKRAHPKKDQVAGFINAVLEKDLTAPRKQRHTAYRIYQRIRKELLIDVGESSVRTWVREQKTEMGLLGREIFIPQSYGWGQEAQVDWYEAYAELDGELRKIEIFSMRSMASGAAFHRAYPRATQQAFLEAHELAFHYFGGVFRCCRYDNLTSAVKKILRGHKREETTRFIAFRSHWKFQAEFCRPGKQGAHEKGGVEGEVGYFRRNHLVPVPTTDDLVTLNEQILKACREDEQRKISGRPQRIGIAMTQERPYLLPLVESGFDLAEISFPIVDSKGCVKVRSNFYSVPVKAGVKVRVKLMPAVVEIWQADKLIALHERCFGRSQEILNLEHYLDVLERKPGAFAGSTPLQQWRKAGRWPIIFDLCWQDLQERLGKQAGTKAMIELLQLGRQVGYEQLRSAIAKALARGCRDAAAIRHLMIADQLRHQPAETFDIGELKQYERPLPQVNNYDQLLEVG